MSTVAIIVDVRGGAAPRAIVKGHRSAAADAVPHIVLSVASGNGAEIDVQMSIEQAERAQLQLAGAIANARRPRREEASGE